MSTFRITKMKHFQTIKKGLRLIGIQPNDHDDRYYPLNGRNLSCILSCMVPVYCGTSFFFYEADSIKEYMEFFYVTIVAGSAFTSFIHTIFNSKKLFIFLDSNDNFHADCDGEQWPISFIFLQFNAIL